MNQSGIKIPTLFLIVGKFIVQLQQLYWKDQKLNIKTFLGQNRLRAKVSAVSEDSTFARSPLSEVQTSTNNNSNSVAPRHIFRNSFRRTKNKHKLVQESDHSQGGEETGNDYLILNMYRRLFSRSHVYGSLGTPSKQTRVQ